MVQEYYVVHFTKDGWKRISKSVKNLREAKVMFDALKVKYPQSRILAEGVPVLH